RLVSLSGTAVDGASLEILEPAGALDFGIARLDGRRHGTVVLRNKGSQATEVRANLVGSAFELIAPASATFAVGPLETVSLELDFVGVTDGPHEGSLELSRAGASPLSVPLTGTCVAPRVSVTPSPVDFGTLALGWTSPSEFIAISN